MSEITVIVRVLTAILLGFSAALLWISWRHEWRDVFFVWYFGFSIFTVLVQWMTGLSWIFAVISWCICLIAMIASAFRAWQRSQRKQTEQLIAERQRAIKEIQRNHQELMQFAWSVKASLAEEEDADDRSNI